jgi:predicted MPP superfamily phosphohydrolase
VFVSDLHLGQINSENFARKVVGKIQTLQPDIVFIGGDLFDGTAFAENAAEPFRNLKPKLGLYFITGNHEEFRDSGKFIAAIKNAGIEILEDNLVEIEGLQVLGVDYNHASDRQRFALILEGLNIDPNKPSILLKHEPKDIDITATANISLQLSGHTHRAQMWPLNYLAKWIYKGFDYGLKRVGQSETQVFTSSGVGTWGPPMRVGTDSEIVVIRFT